MHVLLALAPLVDENVPEGHGWQAPADAAPSTDEYVPALHATQVPTEELPVVAEYVPRRHGMHTLAFVPPG